MIKYFYLHHLQTKVDAHANGLLDIGINSGDTIGIWMDECPERHVSLLACAKAGLKVADIGLEFL